jgi:hypothetical protein
MPQHGLNAFQNLPIRIHPFSVGLFTFLVATLTDHHGNQRCDADKNPKNKRPV